MWQFQDTSFWILDMVCCFFSLFRVGVLGIATEKKKLLCGKQRKHYKRLCSIIFISYKMVNRIQQGGSRPYIGASNNRTSKVAVSRHHPDRNCHFHNWNTSPPRFTRFWEPVREPREVDGTCHLWVAFCRCQRSLAWYSCTGRSSFKRFPTMAGSH